MPFARALLRDLAGELLLRAGLTRPARAARGRLLVATFHRVLPDAQRAEYPLPELVVTPDELTWFARFFAAHFTCVLLPEATARLARAERPDRPLLCITFDDGQRDNFLHARPVLARAGLRATFFAVARALEDDRPLWYDRVAYAVARGLARSPGEMAVALRELGVEGAAPGLLAAAALERLKRLPAEEAERQADALERAAGGAWKPAWDALMSAEELRSLRADGHEIGSHSTSHAILTACTPDRLRDETAGARARLEAAIDGPVTSFCYPNGDHDARVVEAVRAAGYERAVTTLWGQNDPGTPPLALRRCDVQDRTARSASGQLSEARLAWRLSGLHPGLRA